MTTAEQNKAIFLRFVDELRKGNLAIIDEVCSADFSFHSPNWPNWPRGIEGARKLATYGRQLYRDAHATIDDIIAENDSVAVRWTITGTWIGPQRPGSPPYGQPCAVGLMSWYHFLNGKIVEDWGTEVFWPTGTPESEIGKWRSTR
jgi:hypothetical protein